MGEAIPSQYKKLLSILRNGNQTSLVDVISTFPDIRAEIDAHKHCAEVVDDLEADRLKYDACRQTVEATVEHHGLIECGEVLHDSIDDCADILADLDEIEKIEFIADHVGDVWWQYVFSYDSHFGAHMKNLESQVESLVVSGILEYISTEDVSDG